MKRLFRTIVAAAALIAGSTLAEEFKAVNTGPLVTSVWNQTWPYVNFAPVNRSSHEHMPNGCVAVALSQTMRYWDWPTRTEETWLGANFADGVPGFEQRIPAGSEIDWASMLDDYLKPTYADFLTLGKGQVLTSIVVEMKFKKLAAGADASRFDKNPWFLRTTEMNNVEGGSGAPPYAERYARVREALTNGVPLLCTVDVGNIGHEIIVDGWRETNDTDGEVHVNYGWGGLSNEWRPFKTCGVKTVMFGFVPRPKVIASPLVARAALPLAVRWHFPKKGYEKSLKGFAISYAEAKDETETWQDDFGTMQGSFWGEGITRETVAGCGEASPVLRIDNDSDRSTYTWPAKLIGTGSELSFRYRSDSAKNQSVLVEAYEASHGWRTLESLALCPDDAANWMPRTISLADYEGKAVAVRFRTERAGVGADKIVGSPQFGVQIDDVKITNVRKLNPSKTLWVDSETRACSLGGDALEAGKTYVIAVSPDVPNGEAGYGIATTIVESQPGKAGIAGVQSVRKTGCQFHSGIYRDCYIGTNQFAVYTTVATTKLTASLSHPALIDEIMVEDAAAAEPGTMIPSPSSVSLGKAVKVEKGSSGKWLVTLDFSELTDASRNAQEIVTLDAEDEDGNVARKEIYVCLVQQGDETPIEPSDIPDYTGADESKDGTLPPLVETKCVIRFEANGGSGTADVRFDNGDTIAFPEVSRPGYALDGWYTQINGGDRIAPTARVMKSATCYAHWIESVEPIIPDDPDDPVEETPVVTPTFPKANDAGPNDDTTARTRFCPGVTLTSGWHDVNKTSTSAYVGPGPVNLARWWVARYTVANGAAPIGYTSIADTDVSSSNSLDYMTYLKKTVLKNCSEASLYFPDETTPASVWGVSATDTKKVAVGRNIYDALANGPIGFCAGYTSDYYGVIWGCQYETDATGNYADLVYFTCSKGKNDGLENIALKMGDYYDETDNGEVMMKGYGGGGNAIFKFFYPISGPKPESTGDGEVTVKVSAGGKEFDISKAFSKVEKGARNVITYTLDATPGKRIDVNGEQISIQPEFANDDNATAFEVRDDKFIFKVKSIPGLKYQVLHSDSLDPDNFTPAGREREAIGTRRELSVTRSGETKGFFRVRVGR